MTVTDRFRAVCTGDAPWEVLARASLTGPPDKSRIDGIGARWGVTRLGPPLRATSRVDVDQAEGAADA